MKQIEFKTNNELAHFIHNTKGKFAVQVLGVDTVLEVFAEKNDLARNFYNDQDAEFYVFQREDEDFHVLARI